jgi:hypothetical protein
MPLGAAPSPSPQPRSPRRAPEATSRADSNGQVLGHDIECLRHVAIAQPRHVTHHKPPFASLHERGDALRRLCGVQQSPSPNPKLQGGGKAQLPVSNPTEAAKKAAPAGCCSAKTARRRCHGCQTGVLGPPLAAAGSAIPGLPPTSATSLESKLGSLHAFPQSRPPRARSKIASRRRRM